MNIATKLDYIFGLKTPINTPTKVNPTLCLMYTREWIGLPVSVLERIHKPKNQATLVEDLVNIGLATEDLGIVDLALSKDPFILEIAQRDAGRALRILDKHGALISEAETVGGFSEKELDELPMADLIDLAIGDPYSFPRAVRRVLDKMVTAPDLENIKNEIRKTETNEQAVEALANSEYEQKRESYTRAKQMMRAISGEKMTNVTTTTGEKHVGRLVSQDNEKVVLRLGSDKSIAIPNANIKSMQETGADSRKRIFDVIRNSARSALHNRIRSGRIDLPPGQIDVDLLDKYLIQGWSEEEQKELLDKTQVFLPDALKELVPDLAKQFGNESVEVEKIVNKDERRKEMAKLRKKYSVILSPEVLTKMSAKFGPEAIKKMVEYVRKTYKFNPFDVARTEYASEYNWNIYKANEDGSFNKKHPLKTGFQTTSAAAFEMLSNPDEYPGFDPSVGAKETRVGATPNDIISVMGPYVIASTKNPKSYGTLRKITFKPSEGELNPLAKNEAGEHIWVKQDERAGVRWKQPEDDPTYNVKTWRDAKLAESGWTMEEIIKAMEKPIRSMAYKVSRDFNYRVDIDELENRGYEIVFRALETDKTPEDGNRAPFALYALRRISKDLWNYARSMISTVHRTRGHHPYAGKVKEVGDSPVAGYLVTVKSFINPFNKTEYEYEDKSRSAIAKRIVEPNTEPSVVKKYQFDNFVEWAEVTRSRWSDANRKIKDIADAYAKTIVNKENKAFASLKDLQKAASSEKDPRWAQLYLSAAKQISSSVDTKVIPLGRATSLALDVGDGEDELGAQFKASRVMNPAKQAEIRDAIKHVLSNSGITDRQKKILALTHGLNNPQASMSFFKSLEKTGGGTTQFGRISPEDAGKLVNDLSTEKYEETIDSIYKIGSDEAMIKALKDIVYNNPMMQKLSEFQDDPEVAKIIQKYLPIEKKVLKKDKDITREELLREAAKSGIRDEAEQAKALSDAIKISKLIDIPQNEALKYILATRIYNDFVEGKKTNVDLFGRTIERSAQEVADMLGLSRDDVESELYGKKESKGQRGGAQRTRNIVGAYERIRDYIRNYGLAASTSFTDLGQAELEGDTPAKKLAARIVELVRKYEDKIIGPDTRNKATEVGKVAIGNNIYIIKAMSPAIQKELQVTTYSEDEPEAEKTTAGAPPETEITKEMLAAVAAEFDMSSDEAKDHFTPQEIRRNYFRIKGTSESISRLDEATHTTPVKKIDLMLRIPAVMVKNPKALYNELIRKIQANPSLLRNIKYKPYDDAAAKVIDTVLTPNNLTAIDRRLFASGIEKNPAKEAETWVNNIGEVNLWGKDYAIDVGIKAGPAAEFDMNIVGNTIKVIIPHKLMRQYLNQDNQAEIRDTLQDLTATNLEADDPELQMRQMKLYHRKDASIMARELLGNQRERRSLGFPDPTDKSALANSLRSWLARKFDEFIENTQETQYRQASLIEFKNLRKEVIQRQLEDWTHKGGDEKTFWKAVDNLDPRLVSPGEHYTDIPTFLGTMEGKYGEAYKDEYTTLYGTAGGESEGHLENLFKEVAAKQKAATGAELSHDKFMNMFHTKYDELMEMIRRTWPDIWKKYSKYLARPNYVYLLWKKLKPTMKVQSQASGTGKVLMPFNQFKTLWQNKRDQVIQLVKTTRPGVWEQMKDLLTQPAKQTEEPSPVQKATEPTPEPEQEVVKPEPEAEAQDKEMVDAIKDLNKNPIYKQILGRLGPEIASVMRGDVDAIKNISKSDKNTIRSLHRQMDKGKVESIEFEDQLALFESTVNSMLNYLRVI